MVHLARLLALMVALGPAAAARFEDVDAPLIARDIVGVMIIALGVLLAISGKGMLRTYAVVSGSIAASTAVYLMLERADAEQPLGAYKPPVEIILTFLAGIMGGAFFSFLVDLAPIGVGLLTGIILTGFIMSLPNVSDSVPVEPVAVSLVLVCVVLTWWLQGVVVMLLTAAVGAFFAAYGLDLFLDTGFDDQIVRALTNGLRGQHLVVDYDMLPLLHMFLATFVVGVGMQLYLQHRARELQRREETRPLVQRQQQARRSYPTSRPTNERARVLI